MQFNDTATETGIVQDARYLTKSATDDFRVEDIARSANLALNRYFDLAMAANSRWDIDDSTYSTYARATTNLISGQKDYQFPSNLIEIKSVKILTSSGDEIKLKPIDENDFDTSISETYETNGESMYYDKRNNAIFLYPSPNYNSTNGLIIEYTRIPNYFLSTDTTKVAGIPQHHHEYLSVYAAMRHAKVNNMESYVSLNNDVKNFEQTITEYWSNLGLDERPTLGVRRVSGR